MDKEKSSVTMQSSEVERGPVSIQDRIKAMNHIVEREEISFPSPKKMGEVGASMDDEDNKDQIIMTMAGDETATKPSYPKRSSVVEMWKKREVSINKSLTATSASPNHAKSSFKFEEKKEEQPLANDEALEDNAVAATPEQNAPGQPHDGTSAPLDAPRRSNVRDSWKKKRPPSNDIMQDGRLPSRHLVTKNPIHEKEEHPTTDDGTLSAAPEPQHNTILDDDSNESANNRCRRYHNTAGAKKAAPGNGKMASEVSSDERSDISGASDHLSHASSNAAFDELKSRWAKFGVQHVNKQKVLRGVQSLPTVPVGASSPTIPSPNVPRRSPQMKRVHLSPSALSPLANSTTANAVSTGTFLKRRTELPMQISESTPHDEPPMSDSRKSTFVKVGHKHTQSVKSESPTRASGLQVDTRENGPKHIQATSPGDSPPQALSLRRMRAKERLRTSAHLVKQSTANKSLARTPEMKREADVRATIAQQSTKKDDNMIRSSLPMQSLFESGSGDAASTQDDLGPDRSPFSTRLEPDFSLSISNSNSFTPYPEPIVLDSKSLQTNGSFDSWPSPAFPADKVGSTNDSSNENSKARSSAASSTSGRSATSMSLASRASQKLRDKRQRNSSTSKKEGVAERSAVIKPSVDVELKVDANCVKALVEAKQHTDFPSRGQPKSSFPLNRNDMTEDTDASEVTISTHDHDETTTMDESMAQSPSITSGTTYNSQMHSTFASGVTSEGTPFSTAKKSPHRKSPLEVVPGADDMVPDEFVSEKNASVASFRTAYKRMSFEQMAKDIREEAGSVLDMEFISKGMHAASESIHKFVESEVFAAPRPRKTNNRIPSPVEEVAIEVEYIADSD